MKSKRALPIVALALIVIPAAAAAQNPSDDWADSAEALFLTRKERQEWKRLPSEEARELFKVDYWRRRDPTPGTEENEFRDMVLQRVATANIEFTLKDVAGSRTARGLAFVLLGRPSEVRQTAGPVDTRLRQEAAGRLVLPRTALDTTEWHLWVYDRKNNRDVLEALKLPTAEVSFVVERGRRDLLQKTSLFAAYREALAKKSISAR